MPSNSSPWGLGEMSNSIDPQSRDQPLTPSTAEDPMSPPLPRNAATLDFQSTGQPQKRPREDDTQAKKPVRRRMACQPCRIRKVKCDNVRPTCAICKSSGGECIYIDNTPAPVVDPTTQLMLTRLDQILAGINGMKSDLNYRGTLLRLCQSLGAHESFRPTEPVDPSNDGSRDYLKIISCKTTADAALTWPIFGGSFPQDALIGVIFNPEVSNGEALGSGTSDIHQVPGGLQSLPDERIPILIERFLDCVHTKNPILDVDSLLRHGRRAAENGLGWDAYSCLILLACALGSVAYPFNAKTGGAFENTADASVVNSSSSELYSRELQLAESYYVLACRRLGLLKHTVLGAHCHFFTGVFLMYTFRPLPAWNHFCQASTFYQIHSKTVAGPDRAVLINGPLSGMNSTQRRLEQSLYWSCFKSECEIRIELPLPQSSIADFEYPHMFPSPPSPPSNIPPEMSKSGSPANLNSPYAKQWNEELSWYYYLTEVALRRISNRIINTFYRKDHVSWLTITPLIPMAEEFEAQISTWSANLPVVMQFESSHYDGGISPSKELGWATSNRLLEMKAWLYQPFLYYAIHSPGLVLDAPENQALRRLVDAAVECNHSILQNRSVRHRHHGIWFDIRAVVKAAVVLSAMIKSGVITIPSDWEDSFDVVINFLRFWEDESPDLRRTRGVVESLLVDSRRSMGII